MISSTTKEIIKHLERASETVGYSTVFDDWLDITCASLEALPHHIAAIAAHQGEPGPLELTDTPQTQEIWKRCRGRYKPYHWEHLKTAFNLLLEGADRWHQTQVKANDLAINIAGDVSPDFVGEVYMEFGISNKHCGQFFTPWNIAQLMAQMTFMDIDTQINDRMKAAIEKDPLSQALVLAGCVLQGDEARRYFLTKVIPQVAPLVDPITVCDPCCGSGIMLLAGASLVPQWAKDWGVVQFYGQDIDQTCVKMARVNFMLYGVNSYSLRCALELSQVELRALPEPHATAYEEAQQAVAAGDLDRVEAIAVDLRAGTYRQASIFDLPINEPIDLSQ